MQYASLYETLLLLEKHKKRGLVFLDLTEYKLSFYIPRLLKLAKIEKHITFHSFRHTFAMRLLDNGVDIYTITTLLGHKSVTSTQVYARTAIPTGTYKITLEYSPKFKRKMPYLHGVPHFLGIQIHWCNTEDDSGGCIIVGENSVKGKVINDRETFMKGIDYSYYYEQEE